MKVPQKELVLPNEIIFFKFVLDNIFLERLGSICVITVFFTCGFGWPKLKVLDCPHIIGKDISLLYLIFLILKK